MEIVPIFLVLLFMVQICAIAKSVFFCDCRRFRRNDTNLGYEEKRQIIKQGVKSADGKEQNTSDSFGKNSSDELFTTKRSFRDAEFD